MKSIVKTAEQLIMEKGVFVKLDDLVEILKEDGVDEKELKARIYTDLMIDGRFFFKDDTVNLSENFTMDEINQIKSAYSMESLIMEENKLEEETMQLQSLIDEAEVIEEELDVEDLIEDNLSLFGIDDD